MSRRGYFRYSAFGGDEVGRNKVRANFWQKNWPRLISFSVHPMTAPILGVLERNYD